MLPWATFTCVCVALLLVAERRGARAGVAVAKPLASTGFLAVALAAGATGSGYGRIVLAALALSWIGDVLLIARGASALFLAGLVAFLLGHVGYVAAFAQRGVDAAWALAALLAAAFVAAGVLRWLWPHVSGEMRGPVAAYVVVITAMVVLSLGTFGAHGVALIPLGAVCFWISDVAVARERFVVDAFANKLWGLPLYYGGQLLLAASVAAAA